MAKRSTRRTTRPRPVSGVTVTHFPGVLKKELDETGREITVWYQGLTPWQEALTAPVPAAAISDLARITGDSATVVWRVYGAAWEQDGLLGRDTGLARARQGVAHAQDEVERLVGTRDQLLAVTEGLVVKSNFDPVARSNVLRELDAEVARRRATLDQAVEVECRWRTAHTKASGRGASSKPGEKLIRPELIRLVTYIVSQVEGADVDLLPNRFRTPWHSKGGRRPSPFSITAQILRDLGVRVLKAPKRGSNGPWTIRITCNKATGVTSEDTYTDAAVRQFYQDWKDKLDQLPGPLFSA